MWFVCDVCKCVWCVVCFVCDVLLDVWCLVVCDVCL